MLNFKFEILTGILLRQLIVTSKREHKPRIMELMGQHRDFVRICRSGYHQRRAEAQRGIVSNVASIIIDGEATTNQTHTSHTTTHNSIQISKTKHYTHSRQKTRLYTHARTHTVTSYGTHTKRKVKGAIHTASIMTAHMCVCVRVCVCAYVGVCVCVDANGVFKTVGDINAGYVCGGCVWALDFVNDNAC